MAEKKIGFKIEGVIKDKEYKALPFGRRLEHRHKIEAFKLSAKVVHISQKRTTNAKAVREAIKLYEAKEYYWECHDEPTYRDDSFPFYYK